MSEHRHFQLVKGSLYSARDPAMVGVPGSQVGVVHNEEAWMRVIQRVYELGRKDMRTDIRNLLEIREPRI